MNKLFFLTDHDIGGSLWKLFTPQVRELEKRDYAVEMINLRQWYSPLPWGVMHKAISLFNMVRGLRKVARQNPGAVFFSPPYHGGVACGLAGIPAHAVLHFDIRYYMSRMAWIAFSHILVRHRDARLYFLHQSLLDDCPVKPLWGRSRMRVLENPDPPLPMLPYQFKEGGAIDAVYMGRYDVKTKNPARLRRLLERMEFPFARFRVIGGGADGEVFKRELGADSITSRMPVEFLGFHKAPWSLIDAPSVLLVTSNHEGWPGVVLEAFASGVPVISTCPSVATRFMLADGRGLDLAGMDEAKAADMARQFLNDTDRLNETRARARAWMDARAKRDYGAYLYETLFGDA